MDILAVIEARFDPSPICFALVPAVPVSLFGPVEKGMKESLVLVDDLAFIVNVKNKTVVTAVNDKEERIFTNIDGAVIPALLITLQPLCHLFNRRETAILNIHMSIPFFDLKLLP